jgi:hypothetical protein
MDSHSGRYAVVTSAHLDSQVPIASTENSTSDSPEMEVWEPPFERWLKLADDLLRDWSCQFPAVRH